MSELFPACRKKTDYEVYLESVVSFLHEKYDIYDKPYSIDYGFIHMCFRQGYDIYYTSKNHHSIIWDEFFPESHPSFNRKI
jgi:hypothetical protein